MAACAARHATPFTGAPPVTLAAAALLALSALPMCAPAATAQPYSRFQVPDSALAGAIAGPVGAYEGAWNALLVAELRTSLASAPEAKAAHRDLRALAARVAAAETPARGSHIAPDAWTLRARWKPGQVALRILAAERESLAAAAQAARDWDLADSLFQRALADYRALGEQRRQAWVLGSLGLITFDADRFARADSLYRIALDARVALGDPLMIGNTLNSLGLTDYRLNRFTEARGFLERARDVRASTGERGPLALTLKNLGLTLMELGELDSARTSFARAVELTVAAGDSAGTANVLVNTMTLLLKTNEHALALALGARVAAITHGSGDGPTEASLESTLGNIMVDQGRYSAAITHFERQAELGRAIGKASTVALALVSTGQARMRLGDYEAGKAPLLEGMRLADSLGDASTSIKARVNLAGVCSWLGERAEAKRWADDAYARSKALEASPLLHDVFSMLAELASERGAFAEARSWYARAEEAGRGASDEARANDFNNLGIVVLNDSLDAAERYFQRALELVTRGNALDLAWQPTLGLGEVAERRGDFPRALAADRRAATLINTVRTRQSEESGSITLLSERVFAIEALIHLLTKLDARYPDSAYASEAFTWSERGRARALSDLLEAAGHEAARTEPAGLAQLQAALPSERVAYLQYSLGDSSSSLWVVTRKSWRHFRLPVRQQIRGRVEIFRRGLADPSTADDASTRRTAATLYKLLLEPAAPMLRGVERLIISPDGALALMPFEALLARDAPGEGAVPRGAYLVENYEIAYSPSATIYAALRGGARGDGILALGNPSFQSRASGGEQVAAGAGTQPQGSADQNGRAAPRLAPLTYTAGEVATLRHLAGARPFLGLTDTSATRDRLLGAPQLETASLLHLATHGSANEIDPEGCGLWMAPGPEQETPGFVSVKDVLALRLDANLVTLSACETGVGRIARGEGVLGLPRAFLAAGARSVMVSLWKVNDASTARLMDSFYSEMLARGVPASRALARAKRVLLANAETRSPFHWAPFVLTGRYPEGK